MDNKYLKLVLKILRNTQKASTNQLCKDNLGSIIEIETEDLASMATQAQPVQEKIAEPATPVVAAIAAPAPQPEVQVEVSAPVQTEVKSEGEVKSEEQK